MCEQESRTTWEIEKIIRLNNNCPWRWLIPPDTAGVREMYQLYCVKFYGKAHIVPTATMQQTDQPYSDFVCRDILKEVDEWRLRGYLL